MTQTVPQYNSMNNVFGLPQPYSIIRENKIKTLYLHPFKLIESDDLNKFISVLNINKNVLGINEALSSSYLKFLLLIMPEIYLKKSFAEYTDEERCSEIESNRIEYMNFFKELLCKVLKIKKEDIDVQVLKKNNEFSRWKIYFFIDGFKFTENDFSKMIEIIFNQNGIPRSSFAIYDAELQNELDSANEWMNSKNNGAELEEQIYSYHVATGVPLSEIQEYTFYQFRISLERAVILKDYEILRPLEASGQIEIKSGKIDHWLCHKSNNNKYGGVVSDKSKLTNMLGDVAVTK